MKHLASLCLALCAIAAALILVSCEKVILDDDQEQAAVPDDSPSGQKTKKFTFTTKGNFVMKDASTRAATYLNSDDNTLTDLWVLDYVGGVLQQQLHQSSTDANWGQPTMNLTYATHHIYFVASRGANPVLSTDNHRITWDTARDTFWKDYEVTVVSTSNGNRAVTLDRVASRLLLSVTDALPSDISSFTISANHWFRDIDYLTGEPVTDNPFALTLNVSESKRGSENGIQLSVFTISQAEQWTTNVQLTATSLTAETLAQTTIENVPFQRNRSTNYSGSMFSGSFSSTISINGDWGDPIVGTW